MACRCAFCCQRACKGIAVSNAYTQDELTGISRCRIYAGPREACHYRNRLVHPPKERLGKISQQLGGNNIHENTLNGVSDPAILCSNILSDKGTIGEPRSLRGQRHSSPTGAERRRWFAAVSAAVERRQTSCPLPIPSPAAGRVRAGAAPHPQVRPLTTRLAAFRLLLYFRSSVRAPCLIVMIRFIHRRIHLTKVGRQRGFFAWLAHYSGANKKRAARTGSCAFRPPR